VSAVSTNRGSRLFPEIRISFRHGSRPTQFVLTPGLQATALSVLLAGLGALGYLGAERAAAMREMAASEAAAARAETANLDLQDELARTQEQSAVAAREREEVLRKLAGLAEQSDALRGLLLDSQAKVSDLERKRDQLLAQQNAAAPQPDPALAQAQQELRLGEAERATLLARLSKNEAERDAVAAQAAQYQTALDAAARRLRDLTAERDRLKARNAVLERQQSQRRPAGGFGLGGRFERALAATGVDVARLFARSGLSRAEGGPFVPPRKGETAPPEIGPERLAVLQRVARALPLDAPVDSYQIGSGFGLRRDPFNHRASVHSGLDFDAPYLSPVYATAAGTVAFAGYRGDYGKAVEINHGNGIETLYAHLHRIMVAVGQQVAAHQQIGLLGSTGRSTGPHVHYEVLVNGEPQDPQKFLGLARLIPAAAR
jgi:murein DD-endopeptidase MepM/ murein hydrolase activator NlpD